MVTYYAVDFDYISGDVGAFDMVVFIRDPNQHRLFWIQTRCTVRHLLVASCKLCTPLL
jgi:hypothetical protein